MHHHLDWMHDLNVKYDLYFDTDPFEPQPDGVHTIFPFWVPRPAGNGTATSHEPRLYRVALHVAADSTLFIVLVKKRSISGRKNSIGLSERRHGATRHASRLHGFFQPGKIRRIPGRSYQEFLDTFARNPPDNSGRPLPGRWQNMPIKKLKKPTRFRAPIG